MLQTSQGWQQYANSIMELSSTKAVKVVGGQVFLGAIVRGPGPDGKRANNGEELTTNPVNDLTPAIEHLSSVSSGYDIGLSTLSLIATGVFFSPLDMADVHNKIKFAETSGPRARSSMTCTASSPRRTQPKKDVNIYGERA